MSVIESICEDRFRGVGAYRGDGVRKIYCRSVDICIALHLAVPREIRCARRQIARIISFPRRRTWNVQKWEGITCAMAFRKLHCNAFSVTPCLQKYYLEAPALSVTSVSKAALSAAPQRSRPPEARVGSSSPHRAGSMDSVAASKTRRHIWSNA